MLCANQLNQARQGWLGMPGHVRQNDTDFTLLQEELNAPILGHCGLILQLAPYNCVNFGGPLPLNGGGSGGKAMGNDRCNLVLLACTYADRISLEIGELLGEKV